jgi:DnaK suppressor protein
MKQAQIQSIRKALVQKLTELQGTGDKTVQEMKQDVNPADTLDRAQIEMDRIITLSMRENDRKLIQEIRETLVRIDEGGFGNCEDCGSALPVKRIEAAPFSRLCIACQQKLEQMEKRCKGTAWSNWGTRYAA